MPTITACATRADKLRDGELIDVSARACEVGFNQRTAITRAAWAECVEWSATDGAHQSEPTRLFAVLNSAYAAACQSIARGRPAARVFFSVHRIDRETGRLGTVGMKLLSAPDDDGQPALTLSAAHED